MSISPGEGVNLGQGLTGIGPLLRASLACSLETRVAVGIEKCFWLLSSIAGKAMEGSDIKEQV